MEMYSANNIVTLFITIFFAILFLQSGFDKVFDWKGNSEFHKSHFEKSPLKIFAMPMLLIITLMEVTCGTLCIISVCRIFMYRDFTFSLYAFTLASVNFLALFFGQRMSKDYAGAAALVPYFILAMMGLYISF
jgi:uncharacterized membrane protein YphA (DoxX/SURF4 family)